MKQRYSILVELSWSGTEPEVTDIQEAVKDEFEDVEFWCGDAELKIDVVAVTRART